MQFPAALIAELAELYAFADAYQAASPDFIAATGLHQYRMGEALVISLPVVEAKVYNRVLGLGVLEPAHEMMIDGALAHFFESGIARPAFHLAPTADATTITGWLNARGLYPDESWVKLYRDASPVTAVETDLLIHEIGPEQAADFTMVLAEGFASPEWLEYWLTALVHRPGWRIYVAYDGLTPAATGAMYCRDGVGWLGFGATRPAFRRRRAQAAIMARRLQDGLMAGCQHFATETWEPLPGDSNPSLNNMLRSGFQPTHRRLNFSYPD